MVLLRLADSEAEPERCPQLGSHCTRATSNCFWLLEVVRVGEWVCWALEEVREEGEGGGEDSVPRLRNMTASIVMVLPVSNA